MCTETQIANAIADLQWAVATIEPHGIIAAFHGYGAAKAFFEQTRLETPEDWTVYMIRGNERRVYGSNKGLKKV